VFNTQQFVGIPIPLFYAQKFYAFSGVLSAFLGSAITIRVMVLMAFLFQFFHVYRAAMKAGSTRKISICVAVMVTWAIYPLTNLYNRSALTEFFAVVFLTCSLTSYLSIIINSKERASRYDMIATGLFFVAAAVTHPLTALFGGLFLAILGLIALFFCENERRLWLLGYFSITASLSLLVLSPWAYVLYRFNNKLTVFSHATNATYFHSTYFFPKSIDHILSRLSPFPIDPRCLQKGMQDVPIPYLDAQITLPLVLLIAVFIYIGRRERIAKAFLSPCEWGIIGGSAGMLVMLLIESVCPKTFDCLGGFFDHLQFPYRLVTYVNLSALVMLIILAGRISIVNPNSKKIVNICLACCITISFVALIQKLVHASAVVQRSTEVSRELWAPLPFGSNSHLNELPATYYGGMVYSIKDGFEKGTVSAPVSAVVRNFNVLDGIQFGQVEAMTVDLTEPTLVITNVQPFPWNHIVINGSLQSPFSVLAVEGRGAVLLPKGRYQLEAVTQVDGVWKFLNSLSWVVLLGWMALYLVFVLSKEPWRDRKN